MHYKRKRTAKVKSTSFYLPASYLRQLDLIASLERQSRSVNVELCLNFYLGGNDEFTRLKRKYYKRKRRTKRAKTAKMLLFTQAHEQSLFKASELV